MKGLICRDLLICYRRTSKSNYVTDILFFLFFLLVLRNQYSCITYLLCVMPLNMSGMPMILKEMDVNQKGLWIASLYPVSSKNLVLSRYVAVFIQQLHYVAMMLLLYSFARHAISGLFYWRIFADVFSCLDHGNFVCIVKPDYLFYCQFKCSGYTLCRNGCSGSNCLFIVQHPV